MKVVILGLGSMGQRRLRLLRKYDSNITIFGVVRKPEKRKIIEDEFNIKCFESLDVAIKEVPNLNAAFICSGPLSHADIINQALQNNLHVFTEINLVDDGYEKNIALAKEKGLKLFLSSSLLYKKEVDYISKRCEENNDKKLNYIYHSGQYLPFWHPWEDYRKVFFADEKTNGVREEMAIDLPWLLHIFGKINKFKFIRSKNTNLDLSSNYRDNCMLMVEHENGTKGILTFDVVCPRPERSLEIYGEKFYITWNGCPDGLKELFIPEDEGINPNKVPLTDINLYEKEQENIDKYASFIVEDSYLSEIKSFFDYIEKDIRPVYTFEDDFETINFINNVESSDVGGNF